MKNFIIYSKTLKFSNIYMYEENFDKHALYMKSYFLEKRYSKQMTDSQMEKVKFGQRLKAGSKQKGVGVPFAITYYPRPKKIAQIMKNLEHLLYQDESVKRVFTLRPMVSNHSGRKLSSYLFRAKL